MDNKMIKNIAIQCYNTVNGLVHSLELEKHPEDSTLPPAEKDAKIKEGRDLRSKLVMQSLIMHGFIIDKGMLKKYNALAKKVETALQDIVEEQKGV